MRKVLILFVSGLLLSQPKTEDSINSSTKNLPEDIKPTIEKIVENSKEIRKIEDATSLEMQKQLDLIKEIKLKIIQLKKSTKVKQEPITNTAKKDIISNEAVKEPEFKIEVEGQIVQWETRERTWLGKFLNGKDILYYPYVVDKDGNKIYLK